MFDPGAFSYIDHTDSTALKLRTVDNKQASIQSL